MDAGKITQLQWRDRTGFAPGSLLSPDEHLEPNCGLSISILGSLSRVYGLSVRKCGAQCLFDRVRLGEMAIASSLFLLLWASGTSFAPRASRSDPAGPCLVFLGVRGLQPWAMGLCLEGPAQSCPGGAYSSGRGLHLPERSRAHRFPPRTPRPCACGSLCQVCRLESPLSPSPSFLSKATTPSVAEGVCSEKGDVR